MKLETGHPICSLCKLELTGFAFESGPGARLCEGCRSLIQTALRRAEPQTVVASAGVQLSSVAPSYLPSALPSAQRNGSGIAHTEAISPAYFEDFSAFSDDAHQSQPIESSNLGYESFEMHFDDGPSAAMESEATPIEEPVVESTQLHQIPLPHAQSSEAIGSESIDPRLSASDKGNATEQSFTTATAEHAISADNASDKTHDTQPLTEAAPSDPWEDPLPAWDYSRSEWPVLMGPPRERSFAKFKVPFAVALMLVFGAGFYYLIYPLISRARPPAATSLSTGQPEPAAQKPTDPTQPVQRQEPSTPSEAPASEPAQPEQKLVRDSGVRSGTEASESSANGAGNAQGRFALQAASFPTQAGADELAQKLRSAGVPSYVVSADLARRGRWFRVRVGRFNSAEDAQRFAGEAQQRAKAAGISLPLVVSQYDQP
jgi:cell division protein FtsN